MRTRAYELRQKLEKLYSGELSGDVVHIVIPKGAYVPQFVHAPAKPALPAAPVELDRRIPVPVEGGAVRPKFSGVLLVSLLAAVIAGAILSLFIQASFRNSSGLDPVVAEAWAPFAKPNNRVLLMAATPLYLVLGPESHAAYGTPTYPAPPEAYPLFRQHRPLASGARLGMIFTNDALGVGSMNAVVNTSSTIRALGAASEILPERPAMMSLLHGRDTVLFGAPVDSDAISEILAGTPLTVVFDEGVKEFVIRDRASGKTIVPEMEANGDFRTVYGLVTILNNRESDHGRLGMVVFSGITSVGTYGAAEYFTSPRALKSLRATFVKEGVSGFPPAYQVVVKCRFENMLLVSEQYYSHRLLKTE